MSPFDLYATYDRTEAVALAAAGRDVEWLCDNQWAAFPGHLLCFAEIGLDPSRPHLESATRFVWVTNKTWPIKRRLYDGYLPSEAWAGDKRPADILLFLRRTNDNGPFTFVGSLAKANPVGSRNAQAHGGWFELTPALTFDVGTRLGAYGPGGLDHTEVDAAVARLDEHADTDAWFDALKALVAYWHGRPSAADGFGAEDLARPMPASLRRWFAYAGRREGVMSGQNFLLAPHDIKDVDDDPRLILFYVENQSCYLWATERAGVDPEVFGRGDASAPWQPEGTRLSQFLVQACLFEAISCHAPFGADVGGLDESTAQQVLASMRRLPFPGWLWLGESHFYYGSGAFAHVVVAGRPDGRRFGLSLGAKTDGALAFLKQFDNLTWDRRSF
jgi:hypothetical protein